ncbi:T9SS type A sorting domain-containing protein, partial [Bacteroidota bacterium]
FIMPLTGKLKVTLFDILGNRIFDCEEFAPAGEYSKEIDVSHLQPGVYFVRVEAGNQVYYEKLVVL